MKYEALVKTVPENNVELVTMNNGDVIKCKKIPLATIDNMDMFLSGVKDGLNVATGALGFIATCGGSKLYSAVGDASTYMRNSSGNLLSASVSSSGKIVGQPGFQEVGLAKEGLKAASTAAKVIPWVALAVTVIEVGTKIILNQKEIKAKQIALYDSYREKHEDHLNNLWTVVNEYTTLKADDGNRTANIVRINNAFDDANNSFRKLSKDAENNKKINDHLVYSLKSALELYSFAYLLKIMHAKVEDCGEYIEKAIEDINEKTKIYEEIYDKCYQQYIDSSAKHEKALKATQYQNDDKKNIHKRVIFDILTGGTAELVSLGSKITGKKVTKDDENIIKALDSCKNEDNPFLDCIENASELILLKKPVFRDDKYLYYQID